MFKNLAFLLLLLAALPQFSFAEDHTSAITTSPYLPPGESDQDGETLGVDSTHENFQVDVAGGSFIVSCIVGRTKKQMLCAFATSAPKIVTPSGARLELWEPLSEEPASCVLEITLIDMVQDITLRPLILSRLDAEPKLLGLPWATAKRESPSVAIELRVHDPSRPGGFRSLQSATIRSTPGKSHHVLKFPMDRNFLKVLTDNIGELFITARVSVLCRISVAQVVGEWQAISAESLKAIQDLQSAAKGDRILFVNIGGEMRADQGLRQYLHSRVQAALWVKSGTDVPPEMLSSLLESVFSSSKVALQAHATKADELISVVIANQVVVSGLKSTISDVIDQTRLAVERGEVDANHTSSEFAAGGSAYFLGVGAGANASSRQSNKIHTESLTKSLAEASQTFRGDISGFSAIDLHQLGDIVQNSIASGSSQLGTFHSRHVSFEHDVNIDLANRNGTLLRNKLEKRVELLQELRTLSSTAREETVFLSSALKDAGPIDEMLAIYNQALHFQRLVSNVEGFRGWGKHNAALGDARCQDRVPEWLNAVGEDGQTNQSRIDSYQGTLNTLNETFVSRIDKLAKIPERIVRLNNAQSQLVKIGDELLSLQDEINILTAAVGATQ